MMALEHDMIGIAMTSSLPGVAAPGSAVPAVGTNPLAVAVPAGDRPPFVLDMATSTVAGGKLEIARRKEATEIPSGWLVDREGNPVTDLRGRTGSPGGMLVPLGGAPETGAYKGFGLALVVEILSALLSGSVGSLLQRTAPEALGNYDGHWFGAFRIDGFLPVADFKKAMDGMLNALEALPTVPGVDRVTIPGLYEAPIVEEALARGIPLHPKVIDDLKLLAEELGIGYDL
jgi:LDH2 family malate/lactate/ureidoglycolate dehydrogenase